MMLASETKGHSLRIVLSGLLTVLVGDSITLHVRARDGVLLTAADETKTFRNELTVT